MTCKVCGKPLGKRQTKFCSLKCAFKGKRYGTGGFYGRSELARKAQALSVKSRRENSNSKKSQEKS